MKDENTRSDDIGYHPAYLVTDSMVLTETYVNSAIRGHRERGSDTFEPARGIVNGLLIGLVVWLSLALFLIAF